ncbi:MAG: hypothetical protein KGZ25_12740 [Planctomycetes bacterium]|nr:hypothetical protein [Planctomycetota bacterium]
MKRLTLRGIDADLEEALGKQSEEWSTSLNSTILRLLKKATGQADKKFQRNHHDLDDLAGTWDEEEKAEFDEAVAPFSRIDGEMWE